MGGFWLQPSAHWLSALKKAGIPSGAALSFDEAMADSRILARQMIVETDHLGRNIPDAQHRRKSLVHAGRTAPPGSPLGEDNAEIFSGTT